MPQCQGNQVANPTHYTGAALFVVGIVLAAGKLVVALVLGAVGFGTGGVVAGTNSWSHFAGILSCRGLN